MTSEGIYYQMNSAFTKPVNISLTMANDSLLKEFLATEAEHIANKEYIETIRRYLGVYQNKYNYDSVFLVSTESGRYYNFNGLDRVLEDVYKRQQQGMLSMLRKEQQVPVLLNRSR